MVSLRTAGQVYFNPRSREGSDCGDGSEGRSGQYFNPRSREGSDAGHIRALPVLGHFNPRSRKGSDWAAVPLPCTPKISIRAPARGATLVTRFWGNLFEFQSALPRGERPMTGVGLTQTEYFNPRSREGSDQDTYDATTKRGDFNPRSREGSDRFSP